MSSTSQLPSLKERQRQEREKLILRAAAELLAERGFHEMSLEDIAARVGIAKGTIYLHFASKDDLVVALLKQGFNSYLRALDDALDSAATPREKLAAVIALFTSGASDQGYQNFLPMMQNPAILTRMAELREEMRQQWERPRQRLAEAIDEGKAAGDFDPTLPTGMIASLLISLANPHSRSQLGGENGLSSAEIAAHVKRFFFKGIAATPHEYPASDQR